MNTAVFDASTLISLANNNLLWLLGPLKKHFKGAFFISPGVKYELIDLPLKSKRFKLEALQILNEVSKHHLSIYENHNQLSELTKKLTELSNSIYIARNNFIRISHHGEMSVLAVAKKLDAHAVFVDERTTRVLIEDPYLLLDLLQNKLHTKVKMDESNLKEFKKNINHAKVFRSAEICLIAYELGLFKHSIENNKKFIENAELQFLDAILWALRLKGCAISSMEINELLRLEGFSKL